MRSCRPSPITLEPMISVIDSATGKGNAAIYQLKVVMGRDDYYDDPHNATGSFDFVLANPPFNVNAVDKERWRISAE